MTYALIVTGFTLLGGVAGPLPPAFCANLAWDMNERRLAAIDTLPKDHPRFNDLVEMRFVCAELDHRPKIGDTFLIERERYDWENNA